MARRPLPHETTVSSREIGAVVVVAVAVGHQVVAVATATEATMVVHMADHMEDRPVQTGGATSCQPAGRTSGCVQCWTWRDCVSERHMSCVCNSIIVTFWALLVFPRMTTCVAGHRRWLCWYLLVRCQSVSHSSLLTHVSQLPAQITAHHVPLCDLLSFRRLCLKNV